MYRCQVCTKVSAPGESRQVHTIRRRNGQVKRELSVCGPCKRALTIGQPLAELTAAHKRPLQIHRPQPVPVVEAADAAPPPWDDFEPVN